MRQSAHALWSDVGMVARPPLLREAATTVPSLTLLLPLANANNPRVIGSAMWEYLTKQPFLHKDSDIDIIWDLEFEPKPLVASEFFHRADTLVPSRIDGEICFPDVGDVAWREWTATGDNVLVKSLNRVFLAGREELLNRYSANPEQPNPLADAAVHALLEELELYPKPGLVSRHDRGSHPDMDYHLMRKSAESLHPFFAEIERNPGGFYDCLKPIGIRAEQRMLEVTGGINTHRGAIFILGMLVAATARCKQKSASDIQQSILGNYGLFLREHEIAIAESHTHGAMARRVVGSSGARGEAARGFPSVFEMGLPHFERLLAQGTCRQAAALETLMLLISLTDDTNLFHRGGVKGSTFACHGASEFLKHGGIHRRGWFQNLQNLHIQFVSEHLSPGGCADLLAAVFFLDRIIHRQPNSPFLGMNHEMITK